MGMRRRTVSIDIGPCDEDPLRGTFAVGRVMTLSGQRNAAFVGEHLIHSAACAGIKHPSATFTRPPIGTVGRDQILVGIVWRVDNGDWFLSVRHEY